MGETLKRRMAGLPVWAWALMLVAVLALYLSYRKRQAAAAAAAQNAQASNNLSSNLGTVPVSNLTTAASPMPIQLGDTFVNTTVPQSINVSPSVATPKANLPNWRKKLMPSMTLPAAPVPAPGPAICKTNPNTLECAVALGGGPFLAAQYAAQHPTQPPGPTPPPSSYPGYGAGVGQLFADNPGLSAGQPVSGITGYQVSYNGVPL